MNAKVATFIAVETGILVGMISWLGYSHFQSDEPEVTAVMQEAVAPLRPSNPAMEGANQGSYPINYGANLQQAPSMAQLQPAQVAGSYYPPIYQPIVTQPYVESGGDIASSTAVASPSYSEAVDESALVPEYVAPPPVIYYAPAAVQNVIFANSRSFRNRCRSTPHSSGNPVNHQFPDRRTVNPNPSVVVPRSDVVVPPTVQSPQVSRPRPNTIRPEKIASSPRRPFLPLSSKPMRPSYSAP